MPGRPIQELPAEILLHVFRELDIPDIFTLRKTCRTLNFATRDRSVWFQALSIKYIDRGAPVPGLKKRDITELCAEELEGLAVRAYRFLVNWTAAQPRSFRRLDIRPTNRPWAAPSSRNLAAEFLPGWNGRYLLTLTLFDSHSERENRRYSFELWDISKTQPKLLAELLVAGLLGYAINTSPGCDNVLAITRRDGFFRLITTTYALDFLTPGYEAWFRRKNEFNGFRQMLGLHGLYCIGIGEDRAVHIINVENGNFVCSLKVPLIHADPTLRMPEQQCLEYEIVGNFIITFCKQWIYLYRLPHPLDGSVVPDTAAAVSPVSQLDPIAQYKWRWRIDTIVVQPRRSSSTNNLPPIDLAIRFDTWYPWPVNILHHFVLPSNQAYSPTTFSSTDPSTFPYLTSPADAPFMAQAIPSPLRLFTPSDVVFGAYGTILWIDASTDPTTPSQAGDHGQRIAMKVLMRGSPATLPDNPRRTATGAVDDQTGNPGYVVQIMDAVALDEASADASPQAEMSVLHVQDKEEVWNRVSVNEEEGQVAVGYVDGRVSVYTYAPPV